jgi:hypothetical protein
LERAARTIWCKKSLGGEEEFNDIFAALCRRYDSPGWVTDVLQAALETEIAEAEEVDLALVRLELDAQLTGRPFSAISPDTLKGVSTQELPEEAPASSGAERVLVGNRVNPSRELKQVRAPEATRFNNGDGCEADEQSGLGQLRQRAFQLANQLAHAHGMGHLIKPLSEQGLGFVVQDVPDETLTEVLDEDMARLVTAVWWQLVACSEVMVAPSVQVVAQLKEGSSFQIAIADQAPNQLFAAMSPLEPGLVGSHLWRWLTDEDWQTLVALTETYRVLHRNSRESGQSLWHA